MNLTSQQQAALDQICDFLDSPTASVFILKGYAGTGKTTLLKYIVEELRKREQRFLLMAPTGRAAKVIRDKINLEEDGAPSTIHSAIYDQCSLVEHKERNGDYKLIFPLKQDIGDRFVSIVDEASMISAVYSKHEIFQFGTGVLLEDLLTFTSPHRGGKLIFIGDPAQLPPVSDSNSLALDENHFLSKGLETHVAELTQVMRQSDSAILRNATMIRNLIARDSCPKMNFELKKDDVEVVSSITDTFCAMYDLGSPSNPIVITYSNENARKYNDEIRSIIFPESQHVEAQDYLQCVSNNRLYGILNGEFVHVVKVCEGVEIRKAPVWVEIGGEMKLTSVALSFRDVDLQDDEGSIFSCKVIDSLLQNGECSLTIPEMRSLYVDFKIRNPHLVQGSKDFVDAMNKDPYVNAMQVKYGYAITCHKAQGGEWNAAFVDFENRRDTSLNTLRWVYTAITRAKSCLYSTYFPNTSLYEKIKIASAIKVSHMPEEFVAHKKDGGRNVSQNSIVSPFHSETAEQFLKDKYASVVNALAPLGCSVKKVVSFPYLERYTIKTSSGSFDFDGYYKKNHVFTFRPNLKCTENERILAALNSSAMEETSSEGETFSYEPSTENFKDLYQRVKDLLEQFGCRLVDVVEHPEAYYVRYCLKTTGAFSYIDFFIDGKGFVTYVRPFSDLGTADAKLQSVLIGLQ